MHCLLPNLRRGVPAFALRVSYQNTCFCLVKRSNTRSTHIHSPNSIYLRQGVRAPRTSMCSSQVTAGNYLLWMQLGGVDCGMTTVGSKPRRYIPVRVEGHLAQPCGSMQDIVLQASGDRGINALWGLIRFVVWGLISKETEKKLCITAKMSACCPVHYTSKRLNFLQYESTCSRELNAGKLRAI